MSIPKIVKDAKGVAYGVQGSYAEALQGMRAAGYGSYPDADVVKRPAPSIGYQCSPYVGGVPPPSRPAADPTINVGGKPIGD